MDEIQVHLQYNLMPLKFDDALFKVQVHSAFLCCKVINILCLSAVELTLLNINFLAS